MEYEFATHVYAPNNITAYQFQDTRSMAFLGCIRTVLSFGIDRFTTVKYPLTCMISYQPVTLPDLRDFSFFLNYFVFSVFLYIPECRDLQLNQCDSV